MKDNTPYSDKEILKSVFQKGAEGWDLFYAQFNPMIQSISRRPCWKFTEQEQQDIIQNTYLQIQKALPTFKRKSSLRWFIKRICHHQCVNEVRKQVIRRTWTVSSIQKTGDGASNEMEFSCPKTLDPHIEIVQKERRQALRDTLKLLRETCQDSIWMFYIDHHSYREIAKKLGISVNTVGSRLSKCLDKLQKELLNHPLFERDSS